MTQASRGSVALGLAVFVALATITAAVLGMNFGAPPDNYILKAHFNGVNGIIIGSDVFMGGIKVGSVSDLHVDPDSKGVAVTMSILKEYGPVHRGATCAVRPKSLLGEKYIACTTGDSAAEALASNSLLPPDATSVNVEIDQLINTFDEPTRVQLRKLLDEVGKGVAGRGKDTNETLQAGAQDANSLAAVTDVLKQRDAELRRVIESLTRLTETLATDQQRNNYPDLLRHSDTVLQALKDEDAHVQSGLERMNSFFSEINQGLQGQGDNLQAILKDLPTTVALLDTVSKDLYGEGQIAYPLAAAAMPGLVKGPQIFGSIPDANVFTQNTFTRVLTPGGCGTVNRRNPDGRESNVVLTTVCSAPGGACASTSPNPAACQALLQSLACTITQGQLPGCPPMAGAATPSAPRAPSAGNRGGAIPGVSPGLQQEVQKDLVGYLLK